jgi:ribosomal protein S18 acetylase RimI-like enzyme
MSQILTLRPARADDEEFLFQLFYSVQAEKLALSSLAQDEMEKLIRLVYTGFTNHYRALSDSSEDRIVVLNEEAVGRMILLQSRDEIRLADIAILPRCRNLGVGSALIGQLQVESAMSKRPLRLKVAIFERAVRLYRRLGFYKIESDGPHLHLEWTQRFATSS